MRVAFTLAVLMLGILPAGYVQAQTEGDVTKLIHRLVELDSIDLAKEVKFQPGLEPSLYAVDVDESKMAVLKNSYEVHGKDKPGAAGWYRVSFVVPETIGQIPLSKTGYNLGVESNVLGSWEIYTYKNGKPAGAAMAPTARIMWSKGNVLSASNLPPTDWVSNAPLPCQPGDKITIAILAMASPLGQGSADGFALRHLRLRYALSHTLARPPFFAALHGIREKLQTLKGEELAAFQAKVKDPLSRLDAVFESTKRGKLDDLSEAMKVATKELTGAMKK